MKRVAWAGVGVALFFLASLLARAGSSSAESDLPPDLTHIAHTGCHLDQHLTDVFNAKLKAASEVESWNVEGFARYAQLPDGARRDDWTHSIGSVATIGEATDLCAAWLKKVKAATVIEHHKMGHKLKGDK